MTFRHWNPSSPSLPNLCIYDLLSEKRNEVKWKFSPFYCIHSSWLIFSELFFCFLLVCSPICHFIFNVCSSSHSPSFLKSFPSSCIPSSTSSSTSIWRFNDDNKAASVYKNIVALTPEDVADNVFYSATRPSHVQVCEVMTFATNQAGPKDVARVGKSLGKKNWLIGKKEEIIMKWNKCKCKNWEACLFLFVIFVLPDNCSLFFCSWHLLVNHLLLLFCGELLYRQLRSR